MSEERREAIKALLPEIVGLAEASALAGRHIMHISTLIREGRFPEPLVRLKCGPIWDGAEIREWAEANPVGERGKRLTPEQRQAILDDEGTLAAVAARHGVSAKTVRNIRTSQAAPSAHP